VNLVKTCSPWPVLVLLGSLAAGQESRVITVTGQAQVDAPFDILIRPETASPCDVYFDTTAPPPGCGRVVLVTAGDTGAQVAAKIESTINNWAPCTGLGYSAAAVSNQVTVTGPAPFDLAVNAFDEMGTCAGAPANAPFDGLWITSCQVNNLGNGVACDENTPHTGGLQISASAPTEIPTLPAWAFAALFVLLSLLSLYALRGRPVGPAPPGRRAS